MTEDNDYFHNDYGITISELEGIVSMLMQRDTGTEELDHIKSKGGDTWLETGLVTNLTTGIASDEIHNRRLVFGSNMKKLDDPPSLWELLLGALNDFCLIILIFCAFISIAINMTFHEDKSIAWVEGAAILMAVAISSIIAAWNDYEKELKFQELNSESESKKKVEVIRNGVRNLLTTAEVVVGDIVQMRDGMEIAGDGYCIDACYLQCDESALTGESEPQHKDTQANCVKIQEDLEAENTQLTSNSIPSPILYSGSKIVSGEGKYLVLCVGPHSVAGKIKELIAEEEEATPLQMKLETIARDIGNFGLISAIFTVVFQFIRFGIDLSRSTQGWDENNHPGELVSYVIIGITIIVVAIPEGLPLAVTLSLAYSVKKMLYDSNLVRKIKACETMGGANTICTDKTGTLTLNEMHLTTFFNEELHPTVKDHNDDTSIISIDNFVPQPLRKLFTNSISLVTTEEYNEKGIGQPSEMAQIRYQHQSKVDIKSIRDSNEVVTRYPFTSSRKRKSVIVKDSESSTGYRMYMLGASELMFDCCKHVRSFSTPNEITPVDESNKKDINDGIYKMANHPLRTIGICYKDVNNEVYSQDRRGLFECETSDFILIGVFGIRDILRNGVKQSIRLCKEAGVRVRMVTGDNKATAKAIAKDCRIFNEDTDICMEGPDFYKRVGGVQKRSDAARKRPGLEADIEAEDDAEDNDDNMRLGNLDEFLKIAKKLTVLARARPEDKHAQVTGLRECGQVVAVTGDGTNDAPALAKADVGFSMGIAGTEVAKCASDIILLDDNFNSIVKAIVWGRNIYDSVKKFLQFQLTVNVVAVVGVFIGACILRQAIINAVQMLWINLIMDTLASLALATEDPDSEALLKKKPYGRKDYIVSKKMFKHIMGHSVVQLCILLWAVFRGDQHFPWSRLDGQADPDGTVISGRLFHMTTGEPDYMDIQSELGPSAHFTYVFNLFVFLQVFNFLNARKINDELNIFEGLGRSTLFCYLVGLIVVLQYLFITFGGMAIGCVNYGLDKEGWMITVGIGSSSLVTSFILKWLPEETVCPFAWGAKETDPFTNYTGTSLAIRRSHASMRRMSSRNLDSKIQGRNSITQKRSSVIG